MPYTTVKWLMSSVGTLVPMPKVDYTGGHREYITWSEYCSVLSVSVHLYLCRQSIILLMDTCRKLTWSGVCSYMTATFTHIIA